MNDGIVLSDHNPDWTRRFALARTELLELLREPPILIEHIGSTAVPGLPAKPVIDIIVLVAAMPPLLAQLPVLEAAGYEFRPAVSSPERMFLRRQGADGARTHHLHIHTDPQDVRRHVLFRDILRNNPDIRRSYLALKRDLAASHPNDRQAYSQGKDGFIDEAVRAAGGPPRSPFWNA